MTGSRACASASRATSFSKDWTRQVEAAVRAAAGTLESLGARLVDVTLPGAETAQRWTTIMAYADACAYHRERLDAGPGALSQPVYERMMMGREFSAVDYAEAMRGREAWRRALAQVFETVDVLLAPTTPRPAPPIADDRSLHRATQDATRFTYGGALASIPGLSVPCGFSSDGMPIGMMLEAAWSAEPLLFRVGHAYQQATDWHLRRAPCLDEGD